MTNFKTAKIRTISGTKFKITGVTGNLAIAKYKKGSGPWLHLIDFDARKRLAAYLKAEKVKAKK